MKKFIFTLAVLATVMFALPSQAQIKFGVKGGVNLNKATFSTSDLDSKNYTGFFIGPMVDVAIPFMGFGVDGAILYSQKGINADKSNTSNVLVKELAVPINLKYTLGTSTAGFFVAVGPQFAFNLDKTGYDGNGGHEYSFKSSNISLNFGVGVKMINHIQVSANYNIPCGKTADYKVVDTTTYISNSKTKGWVFGVAYLF